MARSRSTWLPILVEIHRGKTQGRSVVRRCLANEDGLITWATLVAVILFIALIGIVFNVGRVANDKLQAQNAADSVAYSSSLVQARAMNAITATNHMMGELTALYNMHHALGGKVLDDRRQAATVSVIGLNLGIGVTYAAAWVGYGVGAVTLAFPAVPVGIPNPPASFGPAMDIPKGEATIHDAKCLLKAKIIEQYINYSLGTVEMIQGTYMTWSIWPPTVAAGWAKVASGQQKRAQANAKIRQLVQEYRFINRLEDFAIRTLPIKRSIPFITDGLWAYERTIVNGVALSVAAAAEHTAEGNHCVGETLGRPSLQNIGLAQAGLPTASLPLIQDPCRSFDRTQLMRATYPWVQEWRWPILIAFKAVVPESRAMVFYEYHTDRYTKETCQKFVDERGYRLYVIEELDATRGRQRDKGTERWRLREESRSADAMFAVVGIARNQEAPAMALHNFFLPEANATPVAAVSQAMIYNANRPKTWRRPPFDLISLFLNRQAQPVQAWDTLAWTEGATEWKNGKSYFVLGDFNWTLGYLIVLDIPFPPDVSLPLVREIGPPVPKLKLNWQAKLSPVTATNLGLRLMMTSDDDLKTRMQDQVLPMVLTEQLGADFITH